MGNPTAACASTSLTVCLDAPKPARPQQLPTELVRTVAYGVESAWGDVLLPSDTMAEGRRTAVGQQGTGHGGPVLLNLKSGNPELPIALETRGKEMVHQTKQAPGLTTCLA